MKLTQSVYPTSNVSAINFFLSYGINATKSTEKVGGKSPGGKFIRVVLHQHSHAF